TIFQEPVVWYITGLPVILSTYFSCICLVLLFVSRDFIIDKISVLLFIRIFVCLIPLVYISDFSSFSSHFPVVIVSFISYFIGVSGHNSNRDNLVTLIIFGLIICFQVFFTFSKVDVDFFNLGYKSAMSIPIGASNIIASYIVPVLLLFAIRPKQNLILKIILCLIMFSAIVLTKSRGGIISLLSSIIIYKFFIAKYGMGKIILMCAIIAICYIWLLSIPEVSYFFMGYAESDNTNMTIDDLSSGRLSIFTTELQRAFHHPIFGNGMMFNDSTSSSGSHNLIIELFVQSGIIGLFLFVYPIILVIKKGISDLKFSQNNLPWLMIIIAQLIHGMIEVNFFSYSTDIIFWFACGTIMSKTKGNYSAKGRIIYPLN
ncbi:MAG: O-antigen ligase family protein, partial [Muribaculaceae bacterium]